jgi:hypothetical protein
VRRFTWSLALAAALFVAISAALPQTASAQVAEATQIKSGYKGVLGLGLFGAELGFSIPALAGVDATWAYIVFPLVGAGGGAALGYFLFEAPTAESSPELNVACLAIGMALIIPTMVITLSATAYDPDDEAAIEQTEEDTGGPVQAEDYEVGGGAAAGATGGTDGAAQPAPAEPLPPSATPPTSRRQGGPGLARRDSRDSGFVRVNGDGVFLGVPSIATLPMYSLEEMQRLGLREQRSEVRVAVFSATF